jgi:hypothetical protein
MAPPEIELVRVAGDHREVGRQIGEASAAQINAETASIEADLPEGRTLGEQMDLAAAYRATTLDVLPWLVDEVDAIAEGAGVDPVAFFSTGVEEIWYAPRLPRGRCSDLVAGTRATANGHLIIGHNNDLYPKHEEPLLAFERTVRGKPRVLSIGVGPWASVGFNGAGLSLTGNELSPNDERMGVPRMFQFLAMMYQGSLDEARDLALLASRASSYNNVLASRDGRALNVEGSATDAEVTGPDENDVFAHTNNYTCERMLHFEGDQEYAPGSQVRMDRAMELLRRDAGAITAASMRDMLSDHATDPSLCRHAEPGAEDETKTVFWTVADVTDMRITFGRGNPCDSAAQEYVFD